jgi:Zn finger protein HypA/HybF involved in hydrogenase expression
VHEASLVTALIARVEREARAHDDGRGVVTARRVEITLGELAGVEAELLLRAWEVLRLGTVCAPAELVIEREAARWECPRCGAEPPPDGYLRCAACAVPARLARGGDLVLARLTLERPDPETSDPEISDPEISDRLPAIHHQEASRV